MRERTGHPLLRGVLQASRGVFDSCLGTRNEWIYYTCLTGTNYADLIRSEQARFHLERTFAAVDYPSLFCSRHEVRLQRSRDSLYWDRRDPTGEHTRNVA